VLRPNGPQPKVGIVRPRLTGVRKKGNDHRLLKFLTRSPLVAASGRDRSAGFVRTSRIVDRKDIVRALSSTNLLAVPLAIRGLIND
jgi:hypothetical protein